MDQARADVKEARNHVEKADKLFPPGVSAEKENIRIAREHFTSVRNCICDLETLLKTHISSSLPEPLASNKDRITGWIPRVHEHLGKLLESLNKGVYGDSKPLRGALSKIQELIPEQAGKSKTEKHE